jgi:hypothetical protein
MKEQILVYEIANPKEMFIIEEPFKHLLADICQIKIKYIKKSAEGYFSAYNSFLAKQSNHDNYPPESQAKGIASALIKKMALDWDVISNRLNLSILKQPKQKRTNLITFNPFEHLVYDSMIPVYHKDEKGKATTDYLKLVFKPKLNIYPTDKTHPASKQAIAFGGEVLIGVGGANSSWDIGDFFDKDNYYNIVSIDYQICPIKKSQSVDKHLYPSVTLITPLVYFFNYEKVRIEPYFLVAPKDTKEMTTAEKKAFPKQEEALADYRNFPKNYTKPKIDPSIFLPACDLSSMLLEEKKNCYSNEYKISMY